MIARRSAPALTWSRRGESSPGPFLTSPKSASSGEDARLSRAGCPASADGCTVAEELQRGVFTERPDDDTRLRRDAQLLIAAIPRSADTGPADDGRTSKSKIAVGR